jgi:hypothetical protein
MPGVVETTDRFATNQVITSTVMNNIIDQTIFTSDALANGTLALTAGKMKVATNGITSNEMGADAIAANSLAANAVTTIKILDANVTPSKLANSNFGAFTVASGVATLNSDLVTTTEIVDAAVTAPKLSGAQTGTAPIFGVRAWVNFNAQSTANISGTYTRTASTTATVTVDTSSNHGLIVGNAVYLNFTVATGTAPFNGLYVVASVVDSNTFTVVSSTTTPSTGTVSLLRKLIRASGNVANVSVAYFGANIGIPPLSNEPPDAGVYVVNFATAMPDANISISGACNQGGAIDSTANDFVGGFATNEKCAFVLTINVGGNGTDCLHTSVQVIR